MIVRYADPHIDIGSFGSLFNILVRHGSYISYNPHIYIIYQVPYHQSPLVMSLTSDSSPGESLQVLPGAVVGGDPPGHSHLHGATAPDSSAPGACGTPGVDRWSLGRKIFAAARIGARVFLNGRRMSQICSRVWNIEFTIPLESLDHFRAYQSISCHMWIFPMVSHGKLSINRGNQQGEAFKFCSSVFFPPQFNMVGSPDPIWCLKNMDPPISRVYSSGVDIYHKLYIVHHCSCKYDPTDLFFADLAM